MAKLSSQTITGKAFEYSLLIEFYERLQTVTSVAIVENKQYEIAKECFMTFPKKAKDSYRINASTAINFLLDIEPRLSYGISSKDVLELELVADKQGEAGDVRDVLAIRALQKWEIGISAKNNHRAVKHSRLSNDIDFGKKWLGLACSDTYFKSIAPVFNKLQEIRDKSNATELWDTLGDYHTSVYVPILDAFKKELLRLEKENPDVVATRLVEYLIGKKDFYKIIKGDNKVEIQVFNLHGTLNQAFKSIKPKAKLNKLKLPNRLVEVVYDGNSKTTLIVSLNEGWQISFRIHNASSRIEPSLKFDINLVSSPHTLFTTHIFLSES
jgi:hypothetical protein